jgi:signal transduction histidine kinase
MNQHTSVTEFKLRERIKELNCLYSLSKVAWEADNDIERIIRRTIEMLPLAMQHQSLAEVCITIEGHQYSTNQFKKCKHVIEASITVDKKKLGMVQIGYRAASKASRVKLSFLTEEKDLLKAIARELSMYLKRAHVERDKEHLKIQLQHSERLSFVGELSAGIAHELNEPLGRILGFAQLIKKSGKLSDQQAEDIERIVKASLYTREIIKKLMIFSRQIPRQIVTVNLNEIIDSILYFIDVRYQSRGVRIVKVLDENLHPIQGDEVQLSQVLVNLITNAVHAMPTGGDIVITTRNRPRQVVLSVKDNGTGMTKDVKEKIFEPFFTTKPVGQGTGLGLSVVKGIVDSHNGKIAVSTAVGKGSRFEVVLPIHQ